MNTKPLRWDDAVARHDPLSLPFWRFYEEARVPERHDSLVNRAARLLHVRPPADQRSIPPQ
ncbi:MAG: hypothetical protein HY904_17950 [Deltaproteobacteria bacterium]|nr:hypothetical protein [Deltaproteobacteria bacterium]